MVNYERDEILIKINKERLINIHQRDDYSGDNVLHYAIFADKFQFIDRVKGLFENEINSKNEEKNTPMHYACLKGNLDIIDLLQTIVP